MRRVGGSCDRRTDVRVMAATHRDLEAAMADGTFRQDLFFRLNTIPVDVPPLRNRLDDLPELCDHLIAKIALRLRRPPLPVSPATLQELAAHSFPGNVRELENLLERAMVLGTVSETVEIEISPLTSPTDRHSVPTTLPLEGGFAALSDLNGLMEADLIRRALEAWPRLSNREVAEKLGTNRRVLELRMREHGIDKRKI